MYGKRTLLAFALALMHDNVLSFLAPSTLRARSVVRPIRFPRASIPLHVVVDKSNDFSMREEDETLLSQALDSQDDFSHQLALMAPACAVLLTASPAEAADTIPTALWAYAHYASMLGAMGTVVGQRFIVKSGMTKEDESVLGQLNIVYGVFLTLVLVSGYFRVVEVRWCNFSFLICSKCFCFSLTSVRTALVRKRRLFLLA